MAKKSADYPPYMDKRLMIIGLVLLLVGILRFYNMDWPIVLIVIGVVLLVKGFIIRKISRK